MRFDLELNIVSKLTQEGLDNLSEALYGNSNIIPMFWDEGASVEKLQVNKGAVNLSNYNNQDNIEDTYFSSGVDTVTNDLKFVDNIIYGSTVIPVFNSGKYSVNRSKYIWSKNNIVKPCTLEGGRYVCEIDTDVNSDNVIVATVNFAYPGYTKINKNFVYVPWDPVYSEAQSENALEKTLTYIFKKSLADYKFTIYNNKIYLSEGKISYKNVAIGEFQNTVNKMFTLPEFPISNLSVSGFADDDYTLRSSIVMFKKDTVVNIGATVYASFDVVPFVSYIENRPSSSDYIYFNANMHPKVMNYKNGTLCLNNSFSDSSIPVSLDVSVSKESIFGQESFRATAKLGGIGSVATPNRNVKLEVSTGNAIFVENNSNVITKSTLADGTVQCDVVAKSDTIGYYIQKEWVVNGTITIPYKIDVNPDSAYLYMVTSDDPILGKKFRTAYDEKFTESYLTKDISSYVLGGRKVAFVSLQDNNGKLTSRFIKPVTATTYDTGGMIKFRDLYCDTANSAGLTMATVMSEKVGDLLLYDHTTGVGYDPGILPEEDQLNIYSCNTSEMTVLEYSQPLPSGQNIAGYWLITDGTIKVKASYSDDDITLESEEATVTLENIKSESAFVINRESASLGASQLGAFGYLTISEYLKNPFGLTSFSMYCTHSDCIYKKCIHPNPSIRNNFVLDEGKVGCAHNNEWDAANWVCPAQNAQLVNPFIMHIEEIQ